MTGFVTRFRQHRRLAAAGLCGTGLLAMSFSAEAGSPEFYLLTSALASTVDGGRRRLGSEPPAERPAAAASGRWPSQSWPARQRSASSMPRPG